MELRTRVSCFLFLGSCFTKKGYLFVAFFLFFSFFFLLLLRSLGRRLLRRFLGIHSFSHFSGVLWVQQDNSYCKLRKLKEEPNPYPPQLSISLTFYNNLLQFKIPHIRDPLSVWRPAMHINRALTSIKRHG